MIPIEPPAGPAPVASEFYIERNQIKTESFSKLSQIQSNPGDRWIGKITLPVLSADQAADWLGFFDALDGFIGSFWLSHPDYTELRGSARGSTSGRVFGDMQRGSILSTDGWAPNLSGAFRRGDIIQVGDKLKRVVEDADTDSVGRISLKIAPKIYTPIPDNTAIATSNPRGIFRLAEGFVAPSADEMRRHTISFAVEELLL
ncbi:hypothetical protein [Kordiimonas sp. SCSIO 12610]|uniref:hypothetical protein n=1 Tax=Kordiimonas sp. SCSIO 12610 TaxID=2829597 RepID=UPI00210AC9D8|nr:hypothetical protein [Kordiimonas sp. SCSIO 12610]UTW56193.1 hypothetical protein KFF44_04655 [Kordiimonas sp. SCSIO 12610]